MCFYVALLSLHEKRYLLNGLFFLDNLGMPAQKIKLFWILMKQEMMRWQWHQSDHMQIMCTLL